MRSLRYLTGAAAGVGLLVASAVSHAVIIDPTLSYGDSYYVGSINDGIPANPTAEVDYINTLITLAAGSGDQTIGSEIYNRENGIAGPFDTATLTGADKDESENNTTTAKDTFQYILAKYDQDRAGSLVWYIGDGVTGDITVPDTYNGYGVSHISLYNEIERTKVPEPSTLAAMGLGLLAFGMRRRRKEG